jgi:ribosomal protein S18 acetylase RimI-like enzyme
MEHLEAYPTELVVYPLPAPIEDAHSRLVEKGFYLYEGLDVDLATQLVERSREPHIAPTCPNDPTKRFANLEAVERWQAKGRLAMPLVKGIGSGALELAGFGWMGPGKPGEDEPQIPGAEITFAIRLYESALGQRLARPYTEAMLDYHKYAFGNNDGVWLETWGDNLKAINTYEDAGFHVVAEAMGMRHGEEKPRLYMTLGDLAVG